MKRNPGRCPADAIGKRVKVELENGHRPEQSWPADGRGACDWSLRRSPFDIKLYEVVE